MSTAAAAATSADSKVQSSRPPLLQERLSSAVVEALPDLPRDLCAIVAAHAYTPWPCWRIPFGPHNVSGEGPADGPQTLTAAHHWRYLIGRPCAETGAWQFAVEVQANHSHFYFEIGGAVLSVESVALMNDPMTDAKETAVERTRAVTIMTDGSDAPGSLFVVQIDPVANTVQMAARIILWNEHRPVDPDTDSPQIVLSEPCQPPKGVRLADAAPCLLMVGTGLRLKDVEPPTGPWPPSWARFEE
jgi:hypothetical protein